MLYIATMLLYCAILVNAAFRFAQMGGVKNGRTVPKQYPDWGRKFC